MASRRILHVVAALAVCIGLAFAGPISNAHADVVYANGTSPGDSYTNASGTNQGQAVGLSGWYYNNVRNNGSVGINNTYPQAGNASAQLIITQGPGGASSKADIEFLAGGTLFSGNYFANASLGSFSDLTFMQYDWYRDSISTNSAGQHPALRVLLDRDGNLATTGDRGGLVFERAYNGGGVVTDAWITDTVSANTNVWNFGLGLGNEYNIDSTPYAFDGTLSEWQSFLPNAVILGFSSGVGSGWGPFYGAVDNIGWLIDGENSSYNFEVQRVAATPEPGTMLLMGVGVAGVVFMKRRKAKAVC